MSTNTIDRNTVADAMNDVGYGRYSRYSGDVAVALNSLGANRRTVQQVASRYGVTVSDVAADAFLSALENAPTPEGGHPEVVSSESPSEVGFDRETASAVIRAFIEGEEGYPSEQVDALLILAGLEDEPEPEPVDEAEDESMSTIARRIEETLNGLVAFARQHGYRG